MQKRFLLLISSLLVMVVGIGCSGSSVKSQEDAPFLISDFVLDKEQIYQNSNGKFALDYPLDWVIYEGSGIVGINPSKADFQQSPGSRLSKTTFRFYVLNPYVGYENETYLIPSPSTKVAEEILGTFEVGDADFEVLEPIKAININGYDGASFLLAHREGLAQYIIVLRIAKNRSVSLDALGPLDRTEEMQEILNAIALNIRPLDED